MNNIISVDSFKMFLLYLEIQNFYIFLCILNEVSNHFLKKGSIQYYQSLQTAAEGILWPCAALLDAKRLVVLFKQS